MTVEAFSFSDPEEAWRWMRQREARARAATTDEQNAITWGDYFVSLTYWPEFLIFGHIHSREEFWAAEAACGAGEEEIQHEWRVQEDAHERGWRYAWHYSVREPEGELGSTHVVSMQKITEEEFEAAKAAGWDVRLGWELVARG